MYILHIKKDLNMRGSITPDEVVLKIAFFISRLGLL